ncbi:MAG TPA: nuclear transport factor 2 family protein [Candidatus Acidoferrales bacterium]|nr:nuclear transport factor 2 family protein [Candidatus Acidoferrales bacterium]
MGQANPAAQRRPEAAIRELLDRQVEAWNRGDVEAFMAGYWRSDETSFSGTNGVTRGWQGLLDRYKRNYPDRKTMGTLQFQKLEITPLCADAAMILGEWHLQREKPVGGVFTLVARRFPEGWKIIHDHTDSVVPQNQ